MTGVHQRHQRRSAVSAAQWVAEFPEEPSAVILKMTNALLALPTLRLQNDDTIGLVTRSWK